MSCNNCSDKNKRAAKAMGVAIQMVAACFLFMIGFRMLKQRG